MKLKLVKSRIKCALFILILVNIIVILIGLTSPKKVYSKSDSLVKVDSNITVRSSEQKANIDYLISRAEQSRDFQKQSIFNSNSERMQTRLSYIALMAVILIPLFSSKKVSEKKNYVFIIVAYLFFLSFYFNDIHAVDLINRTQYSKNCYSETIRALNKIQESADTYKNDINYKYDLKKINREGWIDNIPKNNKLRKIQAFFHPDISQIVFYIFPITLILSVYLILYQNKK